MDEAMHSEYLRNLIARYINVIGRAEGIDYLYEGEFTKEEIVQMRAWADDWLKLHPFS